MKQVWLFGPVADVWVFPLSALLSGLLAFSLSSQGVTETPVWVWVIFVLGIDVSHVWATLFRVYFDGDELRKRPTLYWGVPLLAYGVGFSAAMVSMTAFWRVLAYVAVWHFIRQQVGWGHLYNRKARRPLWESRLDSAVLYAATLFPVLWWHARLPLPFEWFYENDFVSGLPQVFASLALLGLGVVATVWFMAQLWLLKKGQWFWGRVGLVAATLWAWVGGIVLARDDVTFTVMNVTLHGVPYLLLLFRYAQGKDAESPYIGPGRVMSLGVMGFWGLLWALAFSEEALWDIFVWHEHSSLFFGFQLQISELVATLLVPLLALPQLTHYVLDAFIWRSGHDLTLPRRLGF